MKNISKIISTFFLSLSIIMLLYVFYRSEIYSGGSRYDYYSKYYIISFSLICLSFASFFLRKEIKIRIGLIILSFTVCIYLIEGYMAIIGNPYYLYTYLKKKDPNVTVYVSPFNHLNEVNQKNFPLSGISYRKTIFCNEGGYMSTYQSDRYGFNNPDSEWDKKEIKFILVGSSIVHGACVNENDTIGGNLRSITEIKKGVLNLGYSENRAVTKYATLREYMPLKNTNNVLWIYHEAYDLHDFEIEFDNKILLKYLNNKEFSQNLYLNQKNIEKKLHTTLLNQEKSEKRNIFSRLIKLTYLRAATIEKLFPPKDIFRNDYLSSSLLSKFEKVIKLSKEFVESNGANFYFIYLPEFHRYSNKYYYHRDNEEIYKKIIQSVRNLNIPIIDINAEIFEKHKNPLSLFQDHYGHFNEKSYQLVAKTIFQKIQEYERKK